MNTDRLAHRFPDKRCSTDSALRTPHSALRTPHWKVRFEAVEDPPAAAAGVYDWFSGRPSLGSAHGPLSRSSRRQAAHFVHGRARLTQRFVTSVVISLRTLHSMKLAGFFAF